MNLKGKFLSAGIAIALVAMPTIAMAAGTSLTVQKDGANITSIQSGDTIDVTSSGSIDAAGSINKILASVWSKESLQLTDPASIVLPEGWTLEYTTDSENWSPEVPADLTTVTGVRAVGDVSSNGKTLSRQKRTARLSLLKKASPAHQVVTDSLLPLAEIAYTTYSTTTPFFVLTVT